MKQQTRIILVASLTINFLWLFGSSFFELYNDPNEAMRQVRALAAKSLQKFDLESVNSPKAILIDSVLDCILDPLSKDQEADEPSKPTTLSTALKIAQESTLRKVIHKLQLELSEKKAVISFLSQPIINNHDFGYTHNGSLFCAHGDIDFLFVVPSAPHFFERRESARRRDLYRFTKDMRNKAKLLFFLGKPQFGPDFQEIQSQIDKEVETYGDIIQENFEDVYKNIRLKAVSMLKWTSTYCRAARFVIRTDDDIRFDIGNSLAALQSKSLSYTDFILGERKDNGSPMRKVSHKWYVSPKEYPQENYPPYAYGALLGYPISTVALLYQAALRVEPIWMEDVYLTGICAPKVGVPILRDDNFVFDHEVY
ncbi:beta-1 3-galactosyltransferase 1 [Biomphalaria pfeifferi]|uniref:Hexosyltransferase n=1 Tax=Biomphalaria pfeifferi TaxID=112525 RepID=A0AAD8C927_BIOPF|nr:beta-1 3-galactosyltransferase 1 [Biomphalaria pfeifferi]